MKLNLAWEFRPPWADLKCRSPAPTSAWHQLAPIDGPGHWLPRVTTDPHPGTTRNASSESLHQSTRQLCLLCLGK